MLVHKQARTDRRVTSLYVQIPVDVKLQTAQAAKRDGLTLTAYVTKALKAQLKRKES